MVVLALSGHSLAKVDVYGSNKLKYLSLVSQLQISFPDQMLDFKGMGPSSSKHIWALP